MIKVCFPSQNLIGHTCPSRFLPTKISKTSSVTIRDILTFGPTLKTDKSIQTAYFLRSQFQIIFCEDKVIFIHHILL